MSLLSQEEVTRALTGEPVSLLRERIPPNPTPPLDSISRRGRVRVYLALPVTHNDRVLGVVVGSRTAVDIGKALYLNRGYLLGGGLALVIVVVVVSTLTSLTISRPVRALIRQAEQVSKGEQTAAAPLAEPGTLEVDRLSRALTEMSIMLEERAQYIRTFASNVSHEFKTPLTSMRASIELLADHLEEMSAEDRKRFLEILRQDTERLERLVHRLLELARADVFRPGHDVTQVVHVVDPVVARYRLSGLKVVAEHDPNVATIRMAPEILESILTNLLDNAAQHGGEHVEVTVSTKRSVWEGSSCVELIVTDNGNGIPETEADRIFTPFYTTARDSGRTGLGLSIVKALVNAHKGDVSLETTESGTRFIVRIPT
ncbi:MAG: HAMP domain-containing histidine kinase [Deltaproteobacteria bacterium]|nr:HAMP domain-containing histidine kinase [Deltaproteobacteria bacterium]